MIKRKTIKMIVLVLLMCMSCLIGVLLFQTPSTTASADTTPKYRVLFSYTNNQVTSNLGNNSTKVYRSGSNATSASVKDNDGTNMTFSITAYGSGYSGSETLSNGGWIGSSTVNITFASTYTDHTITVTNGSGTQIKKVTKATTIELTGLTHGTTYNVEYYGFGLGTGSATLMTSYTLTATFSFKVDLQNPTITGASKTMYEVMSNQVVTVTGNDAGSGVRYMYKKGPNDEDYTRLAGSLTKIYLDNGPGLYAFFAEDYAGRTSDIYYAYYDAVLPVGKIYDENDNEITSAYYNGKFRYKATDEGFGMNYRQYKTPGTTTWQTYSESTWIQSTATNGTYTFRAIDLLGNVSEETQIYLDSVAPTGKVYANSMVLENGAKTAAPSLYYSASDTGGIDKCYVKPPNATEYVEYANGAPLTDSGSYSFFCEDFAGNTSTVTTVLMDHDAPILTCSGTEFGNTIGTGFSVYVSDKLSAYTFYVKTPEMSEYIDSSAGCYTVTASARDGKYYFYAVDGLGNATDTVWIELSVAVPTATIVKSDTNNTAYATWVSSTITATLNGQTYIKDTTINQEGDYTLKIVDSATGRGNTYTFSIGHLYKKGSTILPTCTAQGYTVYECVSCTSSYYSDYVPAVGHSYKTTTYSPTCTAQGYTIYKCAVCAYTYTGDIVAAKGHNYSRSVINPTCTTQGYTQYSCTDCGHSYTAEYVSALGHNYIPVPFGATCTDKGGVRYTCSRCGDDYVIYTDNALGHSYYEELVAPSCEADGYLNHICTVCGYEYKTDIKSALGHNYSTWVAHTADCRNDGERIHSCQTCGKSYTTKIPCRGHRYAITDTETDNGTKRNYCCELCGDQYVEYLGDQYTMVSEYVEYLFEQYAPYMIMVFLATAGVWSIVMGIALIVAYKNEDKQKARKMISNYLIGLIVIFAILVAAPYLIRGIAYLVAS